MANLYTSSLISYAGSDPVEVEFAEVDIFTNGCNLVVEHYTAGDALIGVIVPDRSLIENYNGSNTRIRVYPAAGQVANGEKLKLILDEE